MEKKYQKIMLFGVFDHLHDGHRFFIGEASKLGEQVIIAVARDSAVVRLKDRQPMQSETTRMHMLADTFPTATVILGDEKERMWDTVLEHKPDCITLGYDQSVLGAAIEKERTNWPFLKEVITIQSHKGDILHSSLLAK